MKRGATTHPKIAALADTLRISRSHAVGILECLFHWTAKYAPTGSIGRWTNQAIAEAVFWPAEDAERLVNALCDPGCRWVDTVPLPDRLFVHDWHEHADDSVHRALARQFSVFANGKFPSISRLTGNDKIEAERFYAKLKNKQKRQQKATNDVRPKSAPLDVRPKSAPLGVQKNAPCLSLSLSHSLSPSPPLINSDQLHVSDLPAPSPRSSDGGVEGDLAMTSKTGNSGTNGHARKPVAKPAQRPPVQEEPEPWL